MSDSPYRGEYGVEDRVREPSAEERALIAERRARDRAVYVKAYTGGARTALVTALLVLFVGLIAGLVGNIELALVAFVFVLVVGIVGQLTYRRGVARAEARKGRWDPPEAEWCTHETRIRARSLTYAVSTDEDYTTWLLYEIPGDDWAAIDDLWVPPDDQGELPKGELVLTWLEPANECIGAEAHGEPLPRHGAVRLGEPDYEGAHFGMAIVDGFGWSDGDADDVDQGGGPVGSGPIRRVPEDELPAWVREAVRGS